MSVFLETKRLIINTTQLSDVDDLYALQSDPEVMKYYPDGARTLAFVKMGTERAITHHQKHGFSLGTVIEKSSSEFIGRAGLIYLGYDDTQPDIEVGYGLIKKVWNKGYATELTKALIEWGFQHLSIDRIVAVTNPENIPSRRVMEKSGMKYVGNSNYMDVEVVRYEIYKNK